MHCFNFYSSTSFAKSPKKKKLRQQWATQKLLWSLDNNIKKYSIYIILGNTASYHFSKIIQDMVTQFDNQIINFGHRSENSIGWLA
jgi:hypothetical protein